MLNVLIPRHPSGHETADCGQGQTNYLSDDQMRRPKHLVAGWCASGYLQTENADEVEDADENTAKSIYQNPDDDWPRLELCDRGHEEGNRLCCGPGEPQIQWVAAPRNHLHLWRQVAGSGDLFAFVAADSLSN